MLGRVPDLDFLGPSVGLLLRECGVERTFCVGIQVIADQRDLLSFGCGQPRCSAVVQISAGEGILVFDAL